jgi:hypothetical protein
MPKKKLTKAQIKKLIKEISNKAAVLAMDRVMNPDSKVPISTNKLLDTNEFYAKAFKRVIRL